MVTLVLSSKNPSKSENLEQYDLQEFHSVDVDPDTSKTYRVLQQSKFIIQWDSNPQEKYLIVISDLTVSKILYLNIEIPGSEIENGIVIFPFQPEEIPFNSSHLARIEIYQYQNSTDLVPTNLFKTRDLLNFNSIPNLKFQASKDFQLTNVKEKSKRPSNVVIDQICDSLSLYLTQSRKIGSGAEGDVYCLDLDLDTGEILSDLSNLATSFNSFNCSLIIKIKKCLPTETYENYLIYRIQMEKNKIYNDIYFNFTDLLETPETFSFLDTFNNRLMYFDLSYSSIQKRYNPVTWKKIRDLLIDPKSKVDLNSVEAAIYHEVNKKFADINLKNPYYSLFLISLFLKSNEFLKPSDIEHVYSYLLTDQQYQEEIDEMESEKSRNNKINSIGLAPEIYEMKNCGSNDCIFLMEYYRGLTFDDMYRKSLIDLSLFDLLINSIEEIAKLLPNGHRDLNPRNILYNKAGYRFIDFGPEKKERPYYYDYVTLMYYLCQDIYRGKLSRDIEFGIWERLLNSVMKHETDPGIVPIVEMFRIFEFERVIKEIQNYMVKNFWIYF